MGNIYTCSFRGCERAKLYKGLCNAHYTQQLRGKRLKPIRSRKVRVCETCIFPGCFEPHKAKGLCHGHYAQQRIGNELKVIERCHKLDLTGYVNSEGYRLLRMPESPYVVRKSGMILEHRLVMSIHLGRALDSRETIKHRNGNRLDNRIQNLELWTTIYGKKCKVENLVAQAAEILSSYAPDCLALSLKL